MSRGLRGFVGQGMAAKKAGPRFIAPNTGPTNQFPPGTYSFQIPVSGKWKFVAWGGAGGASASTAGASGGYAEITRYLVKGMIVAIVVSSSVAGSPGNTTITLPDGTVVTCTPGQGGGAGGAPGTASGGDVNLAGSAPGVAGLGTGGGAANGGAGAPAMLPFRGGNGGPSGGSGNTPGAGCGGAGSTQTTFGGDGLVIAFLIWRP